MHISISPRSGAKGFKHLPFLNDAIEWENRFTLGRNVSKSTDYIEKYYQKSSKIKFPTKTLICHFENIMHCYRNGKSLELPSTATKEDRHNMCSVRFL